MSNEFFGRPILNSPYEYPSRHWELDPAGQPTGQIVNERRGASFLTPIPTAKGQVQKALGFDETASALETEGQQYELMALINGLRRRVEEWGQIPEPAKWRVTPETARLLKHWRSHRFADIQPFFCQIRPPRPSSGSPKSHRSSAARAAASSSSSSVRTMRRTPDSRDSP